MQTKRFISLNKIITADRPAGLPGPVIC